MLARACISGTLEQVRSLLEEGKDPNEMIHGTINSNPLVQAVKRKNLHMVRLLLEFGADLCFSAFKIAVETKQLEMVSLLWEAQKVPMQSKLFYQLYLIACKRQFEEGRKYIQKQFHGSMDPVDWSSLTHRELTFLIHSGMDPNVIFRPRTREISIITYLDQRRDFDTLEMLLKAGLSPNKGYSFPPIYRVIWRETFDLLIEYGADPIIRPKWGILFWEMGNNQVGQSMLQHHNRQLRKAERIFTLLQEDGNLPPELMEKILVSASRITWKLWKEQEKRDFVPVLIN